MTIVLYCMGASGAFPSRHRTPPYCHVLFVLLRLTRTLSPLHVIVYSQHANPHPPRSYRRLPETKKKARQQQKPASRCFGCSSNSGGRAIFSTATSYDLARIKYLQVMAPRRVIIDRNLRANLFSPKLFCYSLFRSISRYDYLLRHPRCRQLLHPSEPQPQTKGCPRMRHLWDRRTTHN